MQTILGAGGAIGKSLAQALARYTSAIRLVSRTPEKVNPSDEVVAADLTNAEQTAAAVQGSQVVYLTAGLPYNTRVWQQQWPLIMQNVMAACRQHNSKLVFFDNVYMYDPQGLGNMTEETRINPSSKKGKVRAAIARQLMEAVDSGTLTALIARSADFYGPGVQSSVLQETVYKNLRKGRKGAWLVDATRVHSFTYVPDAAAATALLGNTPDAFNTVWHLPTDRERVRGQDLIGLFAREMNGSPRYGTYSKGMIRLAGLFSPILRESYEMLYQNDRDYYFNSEKFNRRFPDFVTTPYRQGVAAVVAADKA